MSESFANSYEEISMELTASSAARLIISGSWPFIGSGLLAMGGNYISTIILTQYNKDFLEVLPLIISGKLLTASTIEGVMYATGIACGRKIGQQKVNRIGHSLQAGLIIAALSSLPIIGFAMFSEFIYTHIGQDEQLSRLAQDYFNAFIWGAPGFLFYDTWQQFLIGTGWSKTVLISTAINTTILAATGYVLVNGSLCFPEFSIAGMGYAYTLANWITLAGLAMYTLLHPSFKKYQLRRIPSIQRLYNNVVEQLKLGLPIGFQVFAELLSVFTITIYAGWLGKDKLAANQILEQYLSMTIVSSYALAQVVGTLVSKEIGAKNYQNARLLGKVGMAIGAALSAVILVVFSSASRPLSYLLKGGYPISKNLYSTIQNLFIINGIGEVGDYARNISSGALRGYYYTKIPMAISIISMCAIPLGIGYVLAFKAEAGMEGIYSARTCGMILGGIILTTLLYFVFKLSHAPEVENFDEVPFLTKKHQATSENYGNNSCTLFDNNYERTQVIEPNECEAIGSKHLKIRSY